MTQPNDDVPLLVVERLRREFPAGEGTLAVLKDVDLTIHAGEMVAIVGASGSGKSTLMNILGCLDRPTSGHYRIRGRETSTLDSDELAKLRREHFGFIFQRYHLLPELTAIGNVEIPAIYAGVAPHAREERAAQLLGRLGMEDRVSHRPGQLSGGQQQRVSIARALMNGADVILADEPTGALDSRSGEEVLAILQELNRSGKTVVIVTHDMDVARRAQRIIEIRDGVIIADRKTEQDERNAAATEENVPEEAPRAKPKTGITAAFDRLGEAFRMAFLSMSAHKLRTFLTMLGIIIGIASVVSVVALGTGSRQKVLANISNLGTNTLEIFAGRDFGDTRSGRITTLVVADADALATQSYVAAVTPTVSSSGLLRFGSVSANAMINGVGEQYFDAKGVKIADGQLFDADSVRDMAQDVVIDDNTRKALFGEYEGSPVGRTILIGNMPARIVGVTQPQQGGFGSSQNSSVFLPYTTVQKRILGNTTLRSITVRVADEVPTALAEQAATAFLTARHGVKDFFILNTDDIRQTITSTTETLTLLIAAIALISLLVGGIGVMNIMLVTVSERVGEIGVRMAVGARQSDIMQQFLIEAIVVCFIGGIGGVGLALALGPIFDAVGSSFQLVYSSASIIGSMLCSTIIGVAFGYLPARSAAQLDPVVALSRN
ncbi:MacB family efflux pump subunit [Pseudochelatococcus contaminans]|uniref:Pyoverdine export ATP-binding/permease protein PvdT n=1 Tax=Pseudochelatococcus contaminans TaxID=1538103 RepID=A0A7W5Z447_9HYPH|nr:MacB family efflux pump subunit [Pseudochelatococcus contaminans]MBB3809624.1 macrolide transport system ATP-binding/permease protein [Pseudochelatococcus contaminans]